MNKFFILFFVSLSFTVSAANKAKDCSHSRDVKTTIDMNECLSHNLSIARAEMNQYLQASLDRNAADPELIKSIKIAQKNWETYRSSNCDSVYTAWREGTIRNAMALICGIRLTKQRTHELWEDFLTYMDSTPPVLPEPQ
ncbi:lysozyme inhibitor LprI family protein [Celerinatantimonas diazotrophica]|uniref:lysozyme inhibitor LprI family protein n=1 Tax=Celerinatantimonas diazotrophica TaxID=412034 RepID=UPI001CC35433|nr:lysozyme inhibitor LprI family protein [Celerinatantimonas diazotrophica]